MGNFNKVSMGTGVLTANGVDVGHLKGNVKYVYNYEIEKFKTGVPRVLRGQQAKELTAQLSAPVAELSAENLSMALGGLTIVSNNGSPVTVTKQARTFAAGYLGMGIQTITLDGPNISGGGDSPLVTSTDELTTYAVDDDYLVDSALGVIMRNPGGSIPEGGSVKVTYKHSPPVSKQINLGAAFTLAQMPIHFEHTRPNGGKKVIVHMWQATADGKLDFEFAEENWIINNVTFDAVADDSHAINPLGYILEEV